MKLSRYLTLFSPILALPKNLSQTVIITREVTVTVTTTITTTITKTTLASPTASPSLPTGLTHCSSASPSNDSLALKTLDIIPWPLIVGEPLTIHVEGTLKEPVYKG